MLTLIVLAVLFPLWSVLVTSLSSRADHQRGRRHGRHPARASTRRRTSRSSPAARSPGRVWTSVARHRGRHGVQPDPDRARRVRAVPARARSAHRPLLFCFLLTFLIYPGLVPSYLVVTGLGLKDSIWALILPSAISAFNLVVIRAFFMNIPAELHRQRPDRRRRRVPHPEPDRAAAVQGGHRGRRAVLRGRLLERRSSTRCSTSTTTTSGRSSGCCRATSCRAVAQRDRAAGEPARHHRCPADAGHQDGRGRGHRDPRRRWCTRSCSGTSPRASSSAPSRADPDRHRSRHNFGEVVRLSMPRRPAACGCPTAVAVAWIVHSCPRRGYPATPEAGERRRQARPLVPGSPSRLQHLRSRAFRGDPAISVLTANQLRSAGLGRDLGRDATRTRAVDRRPRGSRCRGDRAARTGRRRVRRSVGRVLLGVHTRRTRRSRTRGRARATQRLTTARAASGAPGDAQ